MNKVEFERSDFVTLHNNLNQATWRLATATNVNKGLTAEETKAIFDLIYPLARKTQSMILDNGFSVGIVASINRE